MTGLYIDLLMKFLTSAVLQTPYCSGDRKDHKPDHHQYDSSHPDGQYSEILKDAQSPSDNRDDPSSFFGGGQGQET
jgi:hypothetical protein